MNLKTYIDSGSLLKHTPSKDEIANLFRIAERDLRLAEKLNDDTDWQFAIAYNAVLQLASVPIRASGFRVCTKAGHHWATLTILPDILGKEFLDQSDYFNECRVKRNTIEYKVVGDITPQDASTLIREAKSLKKAVLVWLKKKHPEYMPT